MTTLSEIKIQTLAERKPIFAKFSRNCVGEQYNSVCMRLVAEETIVQIYTVWVNRNHTGLRSPRKNKKETNQPRRSGIS